jgi:hypothetical protein
MINSKKSLLSLALLVLALPLVSCGGTSSASNEGISNSSSQSASLTDYVMEAEYIDLNGVSGAGISSEQSGVDMIFGDGTDAQKTLGWSNGYYVGYTYSPETVLTFTFNSDVATTTSITLRLGSELGNITLEKSMMKLELNGNELNYSSMYIEGSRMESMAFYDKTVTNTANIVAGSNTFKLSILSNTLRSGNATGGPMVDCLKLKSTGKITWTDHSDNPANRGGI